MGIFNRVKTIVMADIHEVLDKVEDPIRLMNQYMRELDEQVDQAKDALGQQLYLEKRHGLLVAEAQVLVAKRTRQAELAVANGEDTIARIALQEKLKEEAKLKLYAEQYAAMKQQTSGAPLTCTCGKSARAVASSDRVLQYRQCLEGIQPSGRLCPAIRGTGLGRFLLYPFCPSCKLGNPGSGRT